MPHRSRGGDEMTPAQKMRLRVLIRSLHLELERIDWDDVDAVQTGPHEEVDMSFDYHGEFCQDCKDDTDMDSDLPDEFDSKEWPLCVECGNFLPSCVC